MSFFERTVFLLIFFALTFAMPSNAQTREDLWKDVNKAKSKGLPKTAIEHLDKIYKMAVDDKDLPDIVKSVCEKIVLEGNIQGNKPEEKIVRLEEVIKTADESAKPILKIVLAKWYWHYYSRNRYRFMNRSRTEGLNDKDFTTWDLPKLFEYIGNLYENVLKQEEALKAIPISKLYGFIEKGNQPEKLRPTLFDFFAHEALFFYMVDDQSSAKPMRAFEIESDSPALQSVDKFLKWRPDTVDNTSCNFRAVALFQKVLNNAKESNNLDALLDNDLMRIEWAHRVAVGEAVSDYYQKILTSFAEEYANHPYSATALGKLAQELVKQNDPVKAMEVLEKGLSAYPNSYGASICKAVKAQILQKTLTLETERILLPKGSQVRISYKNIENVYFRLIPRTEDSLTADKRPSPDSINWDDYEKILKEYPSKEWSVALHPTNDYKEKTVIIDLPDFDKGLYYIAASVNSDFKQSNNCIKLSPITVTKLAMVLRKLEGKIEVVILNSVSGQPVKGVKVKGHSFNWDTGWKRILSATTDKFGKVEFPGQRGSGLFLADYKGHLVYKNFDFYSYEPSIYGSGDNVYFFTDRKLYRPGQMLYFKGVAVHYSTSNNDYKVLKNKKIRVSLRDPNYQEVTAKDFQTNEFGSFSGTFDAPSDRLTGSYQLVCEKISGSTQIKIEEYKRPKFKVEIETPKESFQLGKSVKVQGTALAYTGAKVDGAKVKYRVVREVQMPRWCWWYYPVSSSQEITHGVAETDKDGKFTIRFTAKPDLSISRDTEPVFTYKIHADVTDSNGETRSADQFIRIGYTSLSLNLTLDEKQFARKDFEIGIKTSTLDGKGLPGAGKIQIHELIQPDRAYRQSYFSDYESRKNDKSNPRTWKEGKVVKEHSFNNSLDGSSSFKVSLPVGAYRIIGQSRDKYNNPVKSINDFIVIDPESDKLGINIPSLFIPLKQTLQPGETFKAIWATGYKQGPAYIEIEHKSKVIKSFWTENSETVKTIELPITEDFRGGFTVRAFHIKENKEYFYNIRVNVPWENKKLHLRFAHMTSKLQPGQKDTWKIEIKGENAEFGAIEMLAAMYDASLDAFAANSWADSFPVFYNDRSYIQQVYSNHGQQMQTWRDNLNSYYGIPDRSYPSLPREVVNNFMSYGFPGGRDGIRLMKSGRGIPSPSAMAPRAKKMESISMAKESFADSEMSDSMVMEAAPAAPPADQAAANQGPDLDKVAARKNLNETAFFFPHLTVDSDGMVSIEFTVPEALTTWKFLGFAHGTKCEAGGLIGETVTQKDLMVQPNPPRFLREGDSLRFSAKVTNLSETTQTGKIKLKLEDPVSEKLRTSEFGLDQDTFEFSVPAGESKAFGWVLKVPETPGLVKYTVVGATNKLSDGEEGLLPILSRRIFVTESLPLPIIGPKKKNFTFQKLLDSKKSDTLVNQGLTVEVTSNPAWYAVQALPYLMEFPHECSEQIFNRIYANQIAGFIANSDPKIKKVFETWKADEANGGKALYSNLEKNEHLKSVTLLETPWVLDAKSENEQKHRIGVLFDRNRIDNELSRAMKKLANAQLGDGSFSWFPGGRPNSFITLYIMTGFGRMRHLGVDIDVSMALKSLNHLDNWIDEYYREIIRHSGYASRVNINPTVALYLYGRSFFLKERPIPSSSKKAVEFFLDEAREKWLKVNSRLAQGQIALALKRFGDKSVPAAIVDSIRERSVTDEELGMFWRENELSFWWYRAEIETQAVMIELFDEVAKDEKAVESCKVWLLKQKQTQNWKTTKATADAIYALLLKGANLLASDKLVKVSLGGTEVKPEKVEAGTGYYQKIYAPSEVKAEMGNITLTKEDKGVAWGAVHWQYLEDMTKVTPHETNLKLKKTIFVKKDTEKGPTISPVNGPLKIGDLVVIRIELRTDRDMEFIHMKDQRGSGMEPVNVISRYKYQDGLAYYEATKDTATHFYMDYLPKGVYVFEYETRIQHAGQYQTGMAEIQCMYAPEFNSHSQSFSLDVRQ